MFKPFTASLLLLAFVAQTFTAPFVMLDYYLNTSAYAKNCINKARPKMHCNGQCQAMKKIQQQEKKDQQDAERKAPGKIQVISSRSFFAKLNIPTISAVNIFAFRFADSPVDRSLSVFHPPQAI